MQWDDLQTGLNLDLNGQLGLIRASGADARNFLHNQLSQDVLNLSADEVRLASYNSAKGRMYAIFHIWAEGETVYLLTHPSVIETVIKRLRMFVLRSKVTLENVSAEYDISGFVGADALTNQVNVQSADLSRLGILAAVEPITERPLAREIRIQPTRNTPAEKNDELWQWLNIRAGLAYVTADISEMFVPQMLNLDRIGGVNFKKGCYPGQEIVARSHYLGKLKRRMQSASIQFADEAARDAAYAQLRVGMDVFSSADPTQAAGQLIAYARHPFNHTQVDVLYEISLPLLENDATLSFANIKGTWMRQSLPYTLSDA